MATKINMDRYVCPDRSLSERSSGNWPRRCNELDERAKLEGTFAEQRELATA